MDRYEILISTIEERYNPESDLTGPYNFPLVTFTEYQLLELVKILHGQIARLEKRVFDLEKKTQEGVCKECGDLALLSGVDLCPPCTMKWVKDRPK